MKVANAPCSWGTLEFEEFGGKRIHWGQMLDEMAEAGYAGTELGDWGYLPTKPEELRRALSERCLSMRGAFVPVAFSQQEAADAGLDRAEKTARLIRAVGVRGDPPFLVLSDANGSDPVRTKNAGRIQADHATDIPVFAKRVESYARFVKYETGIETVFHHHCAGFIETPEEIDEFLRWTDPTYVNLVFDTGHWAYASGRCDGIDAVIEQYAERIRYLHFKDCDLEIAERARSNTWGYFKAVQCGLFCELGRGGIDFPAIVDRLRSIGYDGWIVVEQDVLPGMGMPKESAIRNRRYLRLLGL